MLNHEVIDGQRATRRLVFLHGILGRGSNWRSIARRLVGLRADWGALLVDLRGHGDSLDLAPPHTVTQCARDLLELPSDLPVAAVLGHSFGGKVALAFSELRPDLEAVFLIDSTPSPATRSGTVAQVLDALATTAGWYPNRREFVAALREQEVAEPIARWLAMNLVREGERMRFGPDLVAIEALLHDYWQTNSWGAVEGSGSAIDMIVGGASDVFSDADLERAAEHSEVHVLKGAGHWVHVDAPDELLSVLAERLPG